MNYRSDIPVKCVGCGKEIRLDEDRCVRIVSGTLKSVEAKRGRKATKVAEFKTDSVWGYLHTPCFANAIGSPDDL